MTYFEEQIEKQLFKGQNPFFPGKWEGTSEERRKELMLMEIKRLQKEIGTRRKAWLKVAIENDELRQMSLV